MWRDCFINANPATIMQRLYQIKAEQDGKKIVVIAHAERREQHFEPTPDMAGVPAAVGQRWLSCERS